MSRNAKLILIVVLAVVLAACVILALTMPGKNDRNDPEISGTNDMAVDSTADTENVGTEGTGDENPDIIIDVENTDPSKPSGNGNGNSGNGNSNKQPDTKVELEIDFDDLLNGGQKDDDDNKDDVPEVGTVATEPTKDDDDDANGPAKVEDQDIVIEF